MRLPADDIDDYALPLTPLIDVVFLLLIFFATSTSFIDPEKDLNIELPEGKEGITQPEEAKDIVVNVTRAGLITVHQRVVTREALKKLLEEATADDPEQAVIIRGDRKAYHEDMMAVMNTCKAAKVKNISMAQVADE